QTLTSESFVQNIATLKRLSPCLRNLCNLCNTLNIVTSWSRLHLRIKQFDRFLDEWFVLEIMSDCMLRDYCVFRNEFFVHTQFQSPILSGNFIQKRLHEFAIRLCAQDICHGFVARRETELKIAAFDSEHVRC